MRLLTRRIYRAFPELDRFPDEACERFVRAARRGWATTLVHATIVSAVVLPGMLLAFKVYSLAIGALYTFGDPLSLEQPRLLAIAALVGMVIMGLPVIAGLWVRDRILRRRVGLVLRTRGSCNNCRYSLLGLPVDEDLKVVCPECGTVLIVDASLGELSGEGGQNTFVPKAANEGIAPPLFSGRTWRRIARFTCYSLVSALLLGGVTIVGFEIWLRSQIKQARAIKTQIQARKDLNTAVDATAQLERAVAIEKALLGAMEIKERVDNRLWHSRSDLPIEIRSGYLNFDLATSIPLNRSFPGGEESEKAQRVHFAEILQAYRVEGYFNLLVTVEDLVREMPADSSSPFSFTNRQLPHNSYWSVPSILGAALVDAHARNDLQEAAKVIRIALTLERTSSYMIQTFRGNPFIPNHALNMAILRILTCRPSQEWLDFLATHLRHRKWPSIKTWSAYTSDWRLETIINPYLLPESHVDQYLALRDWLLRRPPQEIRLLPPISQPLATCQSLLEHEKSSDGVPFLDRAIHPMSLWNTSSIDYLAVMNSIYAVGRHELADIHRVGIETMLALECYRHSHAGYPDTLDELVPTFLPGVPRDPWVNRPISYRKCRPGERDDARPYVLYSVGEDGEDDGAVKDCSGDANALFLQFRIRTPATRLIMRGTDFILNPPPGKD